MREPDTSSNKSRCLLTSIGDGDEEGNGNGNGVGSREGNEGENRDGDRAETERSEEARERRQDGNRYGSRNGAGTGTGVKRKGRTQDENWDEIADGTTAVAETRTWSGVRMGAGTRTTSEMEKGAILVKEGEGGNELWYPPHNENIYMKNQALQVASSF